MRWQPKHLVAGFFFILCLFTFLGSDRLKNNSTNVNAKNIYFSPLKVTFFKLSDLADVVFGMRDNRNGNMGLPSARFLVIAQKNLRFNCKFPSGTEVQASLYEFSENHNMLFGVYYVNCVIPPEEPFFKIVQVSEESVANWVDIPISYTIQDERQNSPDYSFEYGICVPVFFGEKYSAQNLIEFMELNSLLGAERVTIYTTEAKMNYKLRAVFDYYAHQGLLQEIHFNLPSNFSHLWYHGQLAVVTDCLIRHTAVAKYTAFHDLDEFLIPTQEGNVPTVLRKKLTGKIGSLRVPTQYMSSGKDIKTNLMTLEAFEHAPSPDATFTKCVLRPEMVFEQGIHHTSRVIQDDYQSPHADVADLKLYHYKRRGGGHKTMRVAEIYGEQLRNNFNIVMKHLGL